jgi:hypothetical protein
MNLIDMIYFFLVAFLDHQIASLLSSTVRINIYVAVVLTLWVGVICVEGIFRLLTKGSYRGRWPKDAIWLATTLTPFFLFAQWITSMSRRTDASVDKSVLFSLMAILPWISPLLIANAVWQFLLLVRDRKKPQNKEKMRVLMLSTIIISLLVYLVLTKKGGHS